MCVSFSLSFVSDADELQLDTLITFPCREPEPRLLQPPSRMEAAAHQPAARSSFLFSSSFPNKQKKKKKKVKLSNGNLLYPIFFLSASRRDAAH